MLVVSRERVLAVQVDPGRLTGSKYPSERKDGRLDPWHVSGEFRRTRQGAEFYVPFATDLPQIVTELDALPRSKALQRNGTPVRERVALTPS